MADNVNSPSHYNVQGKYEVIDVIEDQNWGEGFNRGNAVKYLLRAGKKDPNKEIEDLEKARWYLDREIERLRFDKSLKKSKKWLSSEEINKMLHRKYNNDSEERIWENGVEIK